MKVEKSLNPLWVSTVSEAQECSCYTFPRICHIRHLYTDS